MRTSTKNKETINQPFRGPYCQTYACHTTSKVHMEQKQHAVISRGDRRVFGRYQSYITYVKGDGYPITNGTMMERVDG